VPLLECVIAFAFLTPFNFALQMPNCIFRSFSVRWKHNKCQYTRGSSVVVLKPWRTYERQLVCGKICPLFCSKCPRFSLEISENIPVPASNVTVKLTISNLVCLRTKFPMSSSKNLLVIVAKPKVYEKFGTATTFDLTFYKNIWPTVPKTAYFF
jgi:hypothetical protein